MKLPSSIKWRLQLWYGLILIFVLSALGFAAYTMQRTRTYHDIDDELKLRTNILNEALHPVNQRGARRPQNPPPPRRQSPDTEPTERPALQSPPPPQAAIVFQPKSQDESLFGSENPGGYYFTIITHTGVVLGKSSNAPTLDINQINTSASTKGPITRTTRNTIRETHFVTRIGDSIIVGRDISNELAHLKINALELAGIGIIVLSLGLMGGYWITAQALKPIITISQTAEKISASDLSKRIELSHSEEELSALAKVLNSTFERLETAFNQQKQFTYDAAHELRTPVAIILTQAQSALKKERSSAEYIETIEACLRAAQRMKRLIESLLELARFDSGQELLTKTQISVNSLITDCVDLVEPIAKEKNITLSHAPCELTIHADYEKLSQVLINLIINAIQYNSIGGSVELTSNAKGNSCIIDVKDTGIGIDPQKLQVIFERFVRLDESRKGSNAGLGLSICKAIVTAHGGAIEALAAQPTGCIFRVTLPV